MNKKIVVQTNQTIADIAIQECGSVEAMFDLLIKNNLTSIPLVPESELFVPSVLKPEVVNFLRQKTNKPIKISTAQSVYTGWFLPVTVNLNGDSWFTAESGEVLDVTLESASGDPVVPIGTDGTKIIVPDYSSEEWVRPSEWLPLTETLTDQIGEALILIPPIETKIIRVSMVVAGGFTVDWGDGTITNHTTNTTATHTYDYDTLVAPTTTDGKKQVILKMYPQVSVNDVTSFTFMPTALNYGFYVDIQVRFPFATSYGALTRTSTQRFRSFDSVSNFTLNNFAIYATELRVIEVDWTKVTNLVGTFTYSGVPKLGNLNLSSLGTSQFSMSRNMLLYQIGDIDTTGLISLTLGGLQKIGNITTTLGGASITLLENSNLKEIGLVTVPNCTTLLNAFRTCIALRKLNIITSSALTNINDIVFNDYNLEELTISDCSGIVTFTGAQFSSNFALQKLLLNGMTIGFSVANASLSTTALDDMFTSLGTASGSQTITITGNPGASTCDTTIATSKGFTVVI